VVDDRDHPLGFLSKDAVHDGKGILHRAFSVFLFNSSGELLIQKRSAGKRLWPGYWSNSCCSHPRRGETTAAAAKRRVFEELGVAAKLKYLYKFRYQAPYKDIGSEHEYCWVYMGVTDERIQANVREIEASKHVSPRQMDENIRRNPGQFTPWVQLEWQRLTAAFADQFPSRTTRNRTT